MEDGYLAWSSMYLHEYLGCIIYMPLTPEEQEGMKHDKYIPNWMYEFTSLPNLAIPISYFCIGVALQLLRTPLIVYFINDQGATAAQVNVLFTVSKYSLCTERRPAKILPNRGLALTTRRAVSNFNATLL